jgi:hypothetical protein
MAAAKSTSDEDEWSVEHAHDWLINGVGMEKEAARRAVARLPHGVRLVVDGLAIKRQRIVSAEEVKRIGLAAHAELIAALDATSEAAPPAPSDPAEPDRSELIAAPTAPDKPKVWLLAEFEHRQKLKNIPKDITTFGVQLHDAALVAVSEGRLTHALTARRFETLLHELGLFPKVQRRTKDARKTHV